MVDSGTGVTLRIVRWGNPTEASAVPLVLIHGLASNAMLWEGAALEFASLGHAVAKATFSEPHRTLCICGLGLVGDAPEAHPPSFRTFGYIQLGCSLVDETNACFAHVDAGW